MEVARAFEVNAMFFPARNESWVVSTEVHTGVQARRPLQRLEMGASVAEVARAFEVNAMFFPARNEPWVSRRRFTPEFKLAALQRLEMGASVAEVEQAFEVNPNVLHRWRREFREGPDARCGRAEDHHAHPIEPALRGEG
jgi:transposase-like protein